MRRDWEPEDLVASWTLVDEDWRLIANKSGATRLGFALLLKFFELEGCFPCDVDELPAAAVGYIASQVKVEPDQMTKYAWSGRTIEYHRAQIRKGLGFHEATRDDEDALTTWLTDEVAPHEVSEERLRESLLARCRSEHIEPPGRIERILGAARASASDRLCATTLSRLGPSVSVRLEQVVADDDEPIIAGERSPFADLKADPGPVGMESLLAGLDRLQRIRALGLPADLFADIPEPVVAAWRARAAGRKAPPLHLARSYRQGSSRRTAKRAIFRPSRTARRSSGQDALDRVVGGSATR